MFATVTLLTLVNSVSGTPYVSGGDSPRGTDCSGLVSWVTNAATGRPIYGDRLNTGHTAATLPDGTPVSSGEGGGVRIGGGGAFQGQFSHHMFLPMAPEEVLPGPDAMPAAGDPFLPPPPEMVPSPPAPDAPIVLMAQEAPMAPPPPPADPFAPPPPPEDAFAPPAPADIAPAPSDIAPPA